MQIKIIDNCLFQKNLLDSLNIRYTIYKDIYVKAYNFIGFFIEPDISVGKHSLNHIYLKPCVSDVSLYLPVMVFAPICNNFTQFYQSRQQADFWKGRRSDYRADLQGLKAVYSFHHQNGPKYKFMRRFIWSQQSQYVLNYGIFKTW